MILTTQSGIEIDLTNRIEEITDFKKEIGDKENATISISVDNSDGELTWLITDMINAQSFVKGFSGFVINISGNEILTLNMESN